jgi:glycosyltransferase involved in cell wall biosynthesis
MKISFVCPPLGTTGGTRVIGYYAQRLENFGHDVTVYSTAHPRTPPLRALKRALRGKRPIFQAPHGRSLLDDTALKVVRLNHAGPVRDADVADADIVIATWWETAPWVTALSPSKGAKAYFVQDYGAPGMRLEQIAPTWTLPLAKITIADWLADLVRENAPGQDVRVVRNAAESERFSTPPRDRQPVPTVGVLAREGRSKGFDIALEAVEQARKHVPDLRMIGFGGATRLPQDADWVDFRGRVSDEELPALYAACDAWLFPSRSEGFGLPILEAMASRTPVISTPVGAAPELISPERGWLLPDFAPDTMTGAILEMAGLPSADWRAMSDAAHAFVTGYTWEDAARAFEAALLEAHAAARQDGLAR